MQNADCTSVRWQNARTSGNTIYEIKLKKMIVHPLENKAE